MLRVHATDTPVKRELRSNVRDTRRENKQTHGGRPKSLISLISCGTKDHVEHFGSCELADTMGGGLGLNARR